jgi:hypothetical protein
VSAARLRNCSRALSPKALDRSHMRRPRRTTLSSLLRDLPSVSIWGTCEGRLPFLLSLITCMVQFVRAVDHYDLPQLHVTVGTGPGRRHFEPNGWSVHDCCASGPCFVPGVLALVDL